jgi:SNF2 family DNA or RNA helicase
MLLRLRQACDHYLLATGLSGENLHAPRRKNGNDNDDDDDDDDDGSDGGGVTQAQRHARQEKRRRQRERRRRYERDESGVRGAVKAAAAAIGLAMRRPPRRRNGSGGSGGGSSDDSSGDDGSSSSDSDDDVDGGKETIQRNRRCDDTCVNVFCKTVAPQPLHAQTKTSTTTTTTTRGCVGRCVSAAGNSSKINTLIAQLDIIRRSSISNSSGSGGGVDKAVVFSQWTGMLDLVAKALRGAGVTFARLDGAMTAAAQAAAVKSLNDDADTRVLLCSLKGMFCWL